MVPQDEGLRRRTPRWQPLALALGLVAGVLALLQAFGGGGSPTTTVVVAGPFGPALDAALAYVGADRVLYLVDLRDGDQLGSKAVPNDRRPAAASPSHAYLGRLSARPGDANWDYWRALPWGGTSYTDLGPGDWMAYAPDLGGVVAAAVWPPHGGGVRLLADLPLDLARSPGVWGPVVPVGEAVLAREVLGAVESWWVLAPGREPRAVALPAGFRPVAGAPGRVAGWAGGKGMIADLGTGATALLEGPLTAAADWDPEGTRLAVVSADPPALGVYRPSGEVVWRRELQPPTSALRFGVSWSPDGTFLVVAEGGTLAAYGADGSRLGWLDGGQPRPQVAAAWVEVVPLTVAFG